MIKRASLTEELSLSQRQNGVRHRGLPRPPPQGPEVGVVQHVVHAEPSSFIHFYPSPDKWRKTIFFFGGGGRKVLHRS